MADLSPYTGVLGNRLAAHLLRRTTFGPTKAQILDFATKTPAQALSALLTFNAITTKPLDWDANLTWVDTLPPPYEPPYVTEDEHLGHLIGWTLDNFRTDNTLRSKMILFLHQNFIVDRDAWYSNDFYDYLKLLEFYSFGSYKVLAKKMCLDNRMNTYLDGYLNLSTNSNENYAREFLELFTIGKGPQVGAGNYTTFTEDDVKAAAKVLSGYVWAPSNTRIDADTGIRNCFYAYYRHNTENKTFSASFQSKVITGGTTDVGMIAELNEFVNMVFDQLATAKNICRKLYRFFVHRNITSEIETDIITPLAINLKANNYNLSIALNQLLSSKHFYDLDDANSTNNKIGGIVKSPIDLWLGAMRYFNLNPHTTVGATPKTIWRDFYYYNIYYQYLINAEMYIFRPPTVAGYAGYYSAPKYDRNWFDSASITVRYYLGKNLLENKQYPYNPWGAYGLQLDIVTWVKNNISNPSNGEVIVDELVNFMLPEIPDASRKAYFLNQSLLGSLSLMNWTTEWNNYISTNNNTVVKLRLELLLKTIMYSQEYQLQ
jgi:uncharacterized protein (DUF1800 family)